MCRRRGPEICYSLQILSCGSFTDVHRPGLLGTGSLRTFLQYHRGNNHVCHTVSLQGETWSLAGKSCPVVSDGHRNVAGHTQACESR